MDIEVRCPECHETRHAVQDEDRFYCNICGYEFTDKAFEWQDELEIPVSYEGRIERILFDDN